MSSAAPHSPLVLAVDLAAMAPLPGNVRCVQGDLTHPSTVRAVLDLLAPHRADVVLCDCAPDVVHQADVDEFVQHDLVSAALSMARQTLQEGGSFVCKVFRGPQLPRLLRRCQRLFDDVQLAKPTASRNSSMEAFIVARRYNAADEHDTDEERAEELDGDSAQQQQQQQQPAVAFVSCGDSMGLDADQTYPLSFHIPNTHYTAYQPRAPAAQPIEPPYKQSIMRQRDKANSNTHCQAADVLP